MILRCPEGHGRVLHIGHYACAREDCGRLFRHAPSVCSDCGGQVFVPACAQCFAASDRRPELAAE